jgi:hypothetical protein
MKVAVLSLIRFSFLVCAWIIVAQGISTAASTCTHYASPTGTGSGMSAAQPFKIANFWALAKPGHTLCLLDGQYTGSASMIKPPQNLSGTASAPITVRALNDGKVTINGQGTLTPVRLYYNNYFVLEGFNAHHSNWLVISLSHSNHNIVRRVAAWDAADNNTNIFGIHQDSYHNLLEDVAGWGIARAVFSVSQGGNNTTFRRAWGRWGGSHVVGGKNTFQLAYNTYNIMCENCVGQFSGERMKETHVLMDYYGKPYTGNSGGTYTNYEIAQPGQIFHATTQRSGTSCTEMKLLGSLAYVLSSDRLEAAAVRVTGLDCITIQDIVVVFQEGSNNTLFYLGSLEAGSAKNLVANRLTGIGGGSRIHSDWKQTSIHQGSTLSAVPNPWTTTTGANLCFRYENGLRTTNALWPWPMNQRIIDAMTASRDTPVNVTAIVEKLLGSIPASCRGPTGTPIASIPTTPVNLQVSQ